MIKLEFKVDISEYKSENEAYNKYEFDVLDVNDEYGTPGYGTSVLVGKGKAILYLVEKKYMDYYTGDGMEDSFCANCHEEFYDELFDSETGSLRDEYLDLMVNSGSENILVPDRLEILPEYRNKGIGRKITEMIRNFFAGCYGIEIIKAFPLQLEGRTPSGLDEDWRKKMLYDKMEQNADKATSSLYRMYEKKGYTRVLGTEFFYYLP